MSQQESSHSMNSLMEAIYGEPHTEYYTYREDALTEQIPDFMQTLINHLTQLCVTQGSADNAANILGPWIREYVINHRNPKMAMEGFLHDFLGLFQQQTQKINKYGQKKLKYLTQTVSKQIFTEMMRMACDLKLQSFNRNNYMKSALRRSNNLVLLVHSVNRFLAKDKMHAFRLMKRNYYEDINREENFVAMFKRNIIRLDKLYTLKNRSKQYKALHLWRRHNILQAQVEAQQTYASIEHLFRALLPDMVETWHSAPHNWVLTIVEHLQRAIAEAFPQIEGTSLQFVVNPNLQGSSLEYSQPSSYRSNISHLSHISMEQCMKNDEIKYDNDGKYIAIPIIADQQQIGFIQICWQYQLPIIFFHRTLQFVELAKNVIAGFATITNRLVSRTHQWQSNAWQRDLFQLFTRDSEIKLGQFQQLLACTQISFIQIYHNRQQPQSCIHYSDSPITPIPDHIYKLIWEKLTTVTSFSLDREDVRYQVVRLQGGEGFCRYGGGQVSPVVVGCLAGLMGRNLGQIGCAGCGIRVKEAALPGDCKQHPVSKDALPQGEVMGGIGLESVRELQAAATIDELQQTMTKILQKLYKSTPIFFLTFYPVQPSQNIYAYHHDNQLHTISLPKLITNQIICSVQPRQSDPQLSKLMTIVHQSPLFSDHEMYLYQRERKGGFRLVPVRVGRRALLLLGTYEGVPEGVLMGHMREIAREVAANEGLFVKRDLHAWAMEVLEKREELRLPSPAFTTQLLYSVEGKSFTQVLSCLLGQMQPISSLAWKIQSNSLTRLLGPECLPQQLPLQLLTGSPLQSHAALHSSHTLIRPSKSAGPKLQHQLSYIPLFNPRSQHRYAQCVAQFSQAPGLSLNSNYTPIYHFLTSTINFNTQSQQFISIPVPYRNATYILLLVLPIGKYISVQVFQSVARYVSRVVVELLDRKLKCMRVGVLEPVHGLLCQARARRVQGVRAVLGKFGDRLGYCRARNAQLRDVVEMGKWRVRLGELKWAYDKIKDRARELHWVYMNGCSFLINKVALILGLRPLLRAVAKRSAYEKGANQLTTTLLNVLKSGNSSQIFSYRSLLTTLKTYSAARSLHRNNRLTSGISKLAHTFQQIAQRNQRLLFYRNLQNLCYFRRSLANLQQQLALLAPRSIPTCLQFLTSRLCLILEELLSRQGRVQVISWELFQGGSLQIVDVVTVPGSSFGVRVKQEAHLPQGIVVKQIVPSLAQVLPQWQARHRRQQLSRLRILTQLLEKHRSANLRFIFHVHRAEINKENIQQNHNIGQRAQEQKNRMEELAALCDTAKNMKRRQQHRKQIQNIKQETQVIANELHTAGVESRIKSKTNAVYRMLDYLNTKKMQSVLYTPDERVKTHNQLKQVKEFIHEYEQRFLCEALPAWTHRVTKTINKIHIRHAETFLSRLLHYY